MGESDYVLAVLPLIADTRGLINASVFKHARPGCVFINIGRGATVDEEALLAALNSQTIAGKYGPVLGVCIDCTVLCCTVPY